MHKDVKDLRLHLPADVSDAIIKDLLEKLSNVKGWDKLAAITCSIAIPIRGNPRHGEFKALVGSNVSSTLPKTAAECMALLKEDTTIVCLSPLFLAFLSAILHLSHNCKATHPLQWLQVQTGWNRRFTYVSARDMFHWTSGAFGGDLLRNILFATGFISVAIQHFLRCRVSNVLLLDRSLKLQLQQQGLLPIRDIFTLPSEQVSPRGQWKSDENLPPPHPAPFIVCDSSTRH